MHFKSIKQMVGKLRTGQVTASDICSTCLRRIERLRELNAFITETSDSAVKQSVLADQRYSQNAALGPLDGIPVAVKDNFSTEGIQTSCASRMLIGYKPPYTATVVQRLQNQGAVMMGKTNMDEFAMGCGSVDGVFGAVRNPWQYEFTNDGETPEDWYISGGSSGGSAVAVATGMAYVALGSDTGGSVRNPACQTGVIGLKPTYGLVSRSGLIPLVNSFDVPGIFTRTADDAALILNAIGGHDVNDSTTVTDKHVPVTLPDEISLENLHIGIPKEYYTPTLSHDTYSAWVKVADMLERAGARVSEVSLPHTQYSLSCYSVLCACEVASNMARYDGIQFGHRADEDSYTEASYAATRHEGFNDVVRGRILAGNYFLLKKNYDLYFKQAERVRRLISEDFKTVFKNGVDLLLTPTMTSDASRHGWFSKADNRTRTQEQDVFTQPVNMAGLPAVNVPATLSSNGLPIGLQLIAKPFHERQMLTVTKWIEREVNFPFLNLDDIVFETGLDRDIVNSTT